MTTELTAAVVCTCLSTVRVMAWEASTMLLAARRPTANKATTVSNATLLSDDLREEFTVAPIGPRRTEMYSSDVSAKPERGSPPK